MGLLLERSNYAIINIQTVLSLNHNNILHVDFQYFDELGIDVGLVYTELWNVQDRMPVSTRPREMLESFLMFQTMYLTDTPFHTVHLLSWVFP